jgi:predicted nucleic acid-binding protein
VGSGKIHGPGNILSLDEEFDSADDEVRLMDP